MKPRRRLWLAAALSMLALAAAPAAHASDPIVVRDTTILGNLEAFRDTLVYKKRTGLKQGVWMRQVGGKTLRATGIPGRAYTAGEIGIDNHGRTVIVVGRRHRSATGQLRSTDWYVYDIAANRRRPLKGLPTGHEAGKPPSTTLRGCYVEGVSIWRSRMAYQAYCDTAKRSGLWVRDGKRTFRLTGDTRNGLFHLTLRGGTLAGILDIGDGDVVVTQFMHEGKRCIKRIDSSHAVGDDPWAPSDVWIANGRLTWVQGSWQTHPYGTFAVLSSKLAPGCDTPGPNARFDFTPETSTIRSMALDGQQLFYAGQDSIRRHTLPAEPSFAPPANDDFENAQPLPGDAPTFASGWTAYATTQPGEPLANSKQTVWYAFRPTTSRPLYVNMGYFFRGEFAIYTGSSLATLTPVPTTQDYVSKRFDAVAGETYWIAVGTSDPDPFYYPFTVAVAPDPLSG